MYANARLGSRLTSYLQKEGLTVGHVEPYSNLQTDLEGYAGLLLDLIKGQVEMDERLDRSDIEAWEQDLRDLEDAGETFFNVTYYLYTAQKPESAR